MVAAFLKAVLIIIGLVFLLAIKTISHKEATGVGTLTAKPSNLAFKDGIVSATAIAAPVVVGIILTAAARARRGSL